MSVALPRASSPYIDCNRAVPYLHRFHEPSQQAALILLDPPAGYSADGLDSTADSMLSSFIVLADCCLTALHPGGSTVFLGNAQSCAAWELACCYSGLAFSGEMTILWEDAGRMNSRTPGFVPFDPLTTHVRWHTRPGHRAVLNREIVTVNSNVLLAYRVKAEDRINPAEKPVELYNFFISLLTKEQGLVVDPFCGSGAALVAADDCQRSWAGCDSDPAQVQLATARLAEAQTVYHECRPLRLWTPRKKVMVGS